MSSVAPDRRLLAAVAIWVALGVAAVAVPLLWPVAAGAALLLGTAGCLGYDATEPPAARLAFFGLSGALALSCVWVVRLLVHPRPANHLLLVAVVALLGHRLP